jgi:hypothetical protein
VKLSGVLWPCLLSLAIRPRNPLTPRTKVRIGGGGY